jgi:hypothetical protein
MSSAVFRRRTINMTFLIIQPHLLRTMAFTALCALFTACSTISTGSHHDETTNFGAYQTFSWINEVPYISDDSTVRISPLTQSKIQQAIRAELERKDYSFTDERDSADFVVAYTVGTRDAIRVNSYPVAYRGAWGWHVRGSYYYIHETVEHSYTEGTLGVDIFDGKSSKPVWHGWAEKTITESDREDPSSVIREGVAKLFESFPR